MGRIRIETVAQMAKHGYSLRALCRCGNNAKLTAEQLMAAHCGRVSDAERRLICKVCKRRPREVDVSFWF